MAAVKFHDKQGGKKYGEFIDQQKAKLDTVNQEFLEDERWSDLENLAENLEIYKNKYMEFDWDDAGNIDIMSLKRMMEKLGMAKTHLELKKMIAEVATEGTGVISYTDFLMMMLGKGSSILKLILMFEGKSKDAEKPKGLPPKRDLRSLP